MSVTRVRVVVSGGVIYESIAEGGLTEDQALKLMDQLTDGSLGAADIGKTSACWCGQRIGTGSFPRPGCATMIGWEENSGTTAVTDRTRRA